MDAQTVRILPASAIYMDLMLNPEHQEERIVFRLFRSVHRQVFFDRLEDWARRIGGILIDPYHDLMGVACSVRMSRRSSSVKLGGRELR